MLELDPIHNNTRVIFIHRDGRDVASSFKARGYSLEKAVNRWVEDNSAIIPYIDSRVAMPVSFEELTSKKGVLKVLRRVADFLQLPVTDAELSLSLLPGTKEHQYQEYCTAYGNDDEKFEDLSASLVQFLADKGAAALSLSPPATAEAVSPTSAATYKATEEDRKSGGLSDTMVEHNEFRTWQMMQAWTEIPPITKRQWSWEEERYFFGRNDVRNLMKRFGYPSDGTSTGTSTASTNNKNKPAP